jgi:hypothetical protein
MYIPSSFSSEEPGSGEGNDNASDGDSDSFFACNSEEIARLYVVVPNTMLPHGVFQHDGNSPAQPVKSRPGPCQHATIQFSS